jgi:hypothetical protein
MDLRSVHGSNDAGAPINQVDTWVFQQTIGGSLFTGPGQASIKALYVDDNGVFAGNQVSQGNTLTPGPHTNTSTTPEPGSLGLIGAGLILLCLGGKRSWQPASGIDSYSRHNGARH